MYTCDLDSQGGNEDDDEQRLTVIVAVASAVGMVILIAVGCFAYRLRRKDYKRSRSQGSEDSGSDSPPPHRTTPRVAHFNPESVPGPSNLPDVYSADEQHQIDMTMFDRSAQRESRLDRDMNDEYPYSRPYSTPRPNIQSAHAQVYDNAGLVRDEGGMVRRSEPNPDYDNTPSTVAAHGVRRSGSDVRRSITHL
ncbi:uncharacterized protein LOC128210637 [Mya arenaria]|uniref:uncharacterized protein LOC128210637 n=1 Tax=Mya arenaria TaxID=6604 RepID=UPI0022E277AD|nr:uncharacterized protein LOC128210637 [Mya arenaria]